MAGGGGTATTSSTQAPWAGQAPYLQRGFEAAQGLLNSDQPQFYPGQTVTDTTAATTQGQTGGLDAAGMNAGLLRRTVAGDFLDAGNPYFQGMVDQIGQAIRPNIDSTFAASGRLGSGAHQGAYASALADQAGRLAFQNYGAERANQINAANNYSPWETMTNIGGQQEAKQGQYLADAAARWDFEQNKQAQKLAQYMNLVGSRGYGGETTQTTPIQSNPWMQAAGIGIGGAGALGQLLSGGRGLLWGK